jgi:hypothetical protein
MQTKPIETFASIAVRDHDANEAKLAAARAMLAALKRVYIEMGEGSAKGRAIDLLSRATVEKLRTAIAQAEAAGITTQP